MNEKIKKITVSAITAILAASCTGCAAVTDLLQEHNIEIPYITSGWRHGEDSESGEPASAGVTGAAETANEQEPAEQLRKGRIGDVTVNWILPQEEGKYMELVAEKLLTAEYLGADERVDLYLAPEEDLAIYVNSDYSLDVREKVGLTDEELEDQFPFTQQMASTDMGVLKAVTWQASPGVCVYRRSIARDVFGTDDPNAVQKELADWTKFQAAAAEMKKKEYFMVSGYYDTFAPYRFTADRHWENDGKMVIPDAMVQWRDMMASFTANAYHNKTQIGEKEWLADQGPAGKVFCFFRAINDIDSRMAAYSLADANMAPEEGNGIYGDYAVCCGPQSYCTGGVWILAAPSTDNLLLDREIMENLTCNSTLLYKIAQNEEIFTNTVSGMRRLAGENKTDSFLGGQNPFEVYYEAASRLNCLPAGNYQHDQILYRRTGSGGSDGSVLSEGKGQISGTGYRRLTKKVRRKGP